MFRRLLVTAARRLGTKKFLSRRNVRLGRSFGTSAQQNLFNHPSTKEGLLALSRYATVASLLALYEFNKERFTSHQIKIAAEWWSKFLPKEVTNADKNKFIKILAKKIHQLPALNDNHNMSMGSFLKIGEEYKDEVPAIIKETLREAQLPAGIESSFPGIAKMIIYRKGNIYTSPYFLNGHHPDSNYHYGEIISTNSSYSIYNENTPFDSAMMVKLTGERFRLIPIDISSDDTNLLRDVNKKLDLNSIRQNLNEKISKIYARIELKNFKGSEAKFVTMTDEEFIEILKDKELFKNNFSHSGIDTSINYIKDEEELMSSYFGNVGPVKAEKIGTHYYQYTTRPGPVMALPAPQDGSLGGYGNHRHINKDDFLLQNGRELFYLPRRSGLSLFGSWKMRACDSQGNITRSEPIAFCTADKSMSARKTS